MTNAPNHQTGHVARNSVLNLVGRIAPSLVAVLTLPMIVHGLGKEGFGILSVAWLVLGYSNIFDLGLGRATTKFVAEYLRPEKSHLLPGLVWTSLALQLLQGLIGGTVIAACVPFVVTHLFRMPAAYVSETQTTLFILCAALPILLVGNAIRGILEASQRFDLSNLVSVPASIAFYLLAPVAVALHVRVAGIVFLQVLLRLAAAAAYLVLSLRELPTLRTHFALSRSSMRPLFSYGGWCTVSTLAGPTFAELERFMIASIVSVGALTYYSAPYELITKLVIFPAAVCSALFPVFSFHGSANGSVVSDLSSRALKFLLLLMTPVTAIFVLFAGDILRIWLGGDFPAQSTVVLQVLALSFLLNVFAQIPYTSVQALGKPDWKAILDLVALPLYALVAWYLLRRTGINGGAYAKLLITIVDTVALFVFARKLEAFSPRDWTSGSLYRTLAASAALVAALTAIRMSGLGLVPEAAMVALACLLYVIAFWMIAMDDGERKVLMALPHRLFSPIEKQHSREPVGEHNREAAGECSREMSSEQSRESAQEHSREGTQECIREMAPEQSREAAKDYSPRRKPWVAAANWKSPEGAKESL